MAAIGHGVRQIIAAQAAQQVNIDMIVVSGGAAQNPLVRQILADAIGIPVAATDAEEPVLVGAAILGAVACGHFADANQAMSAMNALGEVYWPNVALRGWHDRRSEAFTILQSAVRAVRELR